ncbi:MAG TPA: HRDC domain-containing protein, partial [Thermoanaerobaculia bacterium]|nr:HRDC domain-containing protein [Thermoanaerobaculia bacterium]
LDRKGFERLLGALSRAGLVALREDSFDKDGQTIRYRRAALTPEGQSAVAGRGDALERLRLDAPIARKAKKKKLTRTRVAAAAARAKPAADLPPPDPELADRLRDWRLEEARRRKVPAFVLFSDRTLEALATHRPGTRQELLEIHGIGPHKAKTLGEAILRIIGEG